MQNRLDIFDGLILDLDSKAQQQHIERKHPNLSPDQHHQCEFMPIYEKHKRTMGDNWGLEGVERDTQKVYKYAKENFSRAKKNERNNGQHNSPKTLASSVVTPQSQVDVGESTAEVASDFNDKSHLMKRTEPFPAPITPPDSDTAISPNKPTTGLPSMPINAMYPVLSDGHDHMQSQQMHHSLDQDFHLDWNQPAGFSFRSLLEDTNPWFNNNVKDNQQVTAEKRPFETSETQPNFCPKVRRVERCADPELKKLRCGIGGSYRFSLSKLHFNRVSCPYCVAPSEPNGKPGKVSCLSNRQFMQQTMNSKLEGMYLSCPFSFSDKDLGCPNYSDTSKLDHPFWHRNKAHQSHLK